jgi:uncharacterized protein with PQ loop repeat
MREKKILHRHFIDRVALINAFISAFALYPQLFVLLTSFSIETESFSMTSFVLVLVSSILWFWYGVHQRAVPLIVSSFLNACAAGGIIVLLIAHGFF